jgi:organic hydroperoxide reductase OsmC/OhrA
MAAYRATAEWTLEAGGDFLKGRYSRGHSLKFGSGVEVPGTASHQVVGNRWAVEGAVDPEEMLVGAINTCHMLSFLHIAREAGFVVTRYRDEAVGEMTRREDGEMWVSKVTLRPEITYAGARPGEAQSHDLHHRAHAICFIANSVKTEIEVVETAPATSEST